MVLAVILIALAVLAAAGLAGRHVLVAARQGRDMWKAWAEVHKKDLAEARADATDRNWQAARVAELEKELEAATAAPELDAEQARALLATKKVPHALFPGTLPDVETTVFAEQKCQHCGGLHSRACPRVRRIAYGDGGKPAEVQFWEDGRWPHEDVIWLEDVIEAAAEAEEVEQ